MREGILLYETDMFKCWLEDRGYEWPNTPIEQENLIAEFLREGLEVKNVA